MCGGGRKVNDEQHGNTACGLKIHWLSLMERKATCDMTSLMERKATCDMTSLMERKATCDMMLPVEREKERQSLDYREGYLDLSGRDWRRDLQ